MVPVARTLLQHVLHAMRVDEKLASSNRAAAAYAGGDDDKLIGVGIDEPRHDGIVLIGTGLLLLQTVERPFAFSGIGTILNPELRHGRIVGKVKAQRSGEPQGPGIVKGADEN